MTICISKLKKLLQVGCAIVFLLLAGGCAYYNTFYNIKKEFKAAEKQTERAQTAQTLGQVAQQPRPGQPAINAAPVQQYQSILQSCAELLEFYPNSRWIDDALMIMGVSYYRTEEYARSERKFTELLTIFPKSRHIEMSIVWRARALLAQDKLDEAEAILVSAESRLVNPEVIAASGRALATIYEKRGKPDEAVKHLEQIQKISYDRADKASDYLTLGKAYLALGQREKSRDALQRCLGSTRKADEAFTARQLLAEMAAQEGNYNEARSILRPLQTDRRFIERAGDVQLELARVEAIAGNPLTCIQMLEDFCAKVPQGDNKSRAYFLQGLVARDKLIQLELAKAKFDSASIAGASRELQDSARYASKQLENGLSALALIPSLEENIRLLQDEIAQAVQPASNEVLPEEMSFDSDLHLPETPGILSDSTESDREFKPSDTARVWVAMDTASLSESVADTNAHVELADAAKEMTPAEMIADSIMRAFSAKDSAMRAARDNATQKDTLTTTAPGMPESSTPAAMTQSEAEILAVRLASITIQLVNAHLDAASFYSLVLHKPDSAFAHVERAVAVPDSSEDHWRASVQFGLELLRKDRDSARGKNELQRVALSEVAPRAARNAACDALGIPQVVVEKTQQELSLERIESILLQDAPYEEIVHGYREVAGMDSTSSSGSKALHAIAHLQEYKLNDFEGAKETHGAIARLFPDSAFSEISLAKLQPPDSNSVFMMSEEALQATMQPALELLTSRSDSTGWPPDETTLRGRRFR